MAKKKEFDNLVDESFNEGYESEPDYNTIKDNEPKADTPVLSENEILLKRIETGEPDTLDEILNREERSTYYITDVHRACIDLFSHEEGIKKGQVVVDALNEYFAKQTIDGESLVEKAENRVIAFAIKKLEKEIKKEKSK